MRKSGGDPASSPLLAVFDRNRNDPSDCSRPDSEDRFSVPIRNRKRMSPTVERISNDAIGDGGKSALAAVGVTRPIPRSLAECLPQSRRRLAIGRGCQPPNHRQG